MSEEPQQDAGDRARDAAKGTGPAAGAAATQPLLTVTLHAGYGRQTTLQDIAFTLRRGERLGMVGASGAGKSTLVLALLGLLPWRGGWAKGEVLLDGVNLLRLKERDARRWRGKRVALVPQSPMSALNGAVSLQRHFEEAWRAHEPRLDAAFAGRVRELMRQVCLPEEAEFLRRKPDAVSVGQAQRAVLALALLHRPALLIADEPTSSLDPVTQAEILTLLHETNRRDGTALLYVSHDLLSVLGFCERLAVLDNGGLVEDVPIRDLLAGTRHPTTAALLGTLPVPLSTLLDYAERDEREPDRAPMGVGKS